MQKGSFTFLKIDWSEKGTNLLVRGVHKIESWQKTAKEWNYAKTEQRKNLYCGTLTKDTTICTCSFGLTTQVVTGKFPRSLHLPKLAPRISWIMQTQSFNLGYKFSRSIAAVNVLEKTKQRGNFLWILSQISKHNSKKKGMKFFALIVYLFSGSFHCELWKCESLQFL